MSRRKAHPLRPLTPEERHWLEKISRSHAEPAAHVARAKAILAVAGGSDYTDAARGCGYRSGDTVSAWVRRFNAEGIQALEPHHGSGPPLTYGAPEQARILGEFARTPDREKDGTATWSLTTLQRALRRAPDGLPKVSTYTIGQVLHEAGYTYQADRTWCRTGRVLRRRKSGVVEVSDPDAEAKRGADPTRLRRGRSQRAGAVERR